LYALQGFRYCDLLLAAPERTAWQLTLTSHLRLDASDLVQSCRAVSQRAAQSLSWGDIAYRQDLLNFALDQLTLGRAALYAAILERSAAFTPLQRPKESADANDDERRSDLK